ncbi:MAG: hypothetical protein ACK4UN_00665 [Limisphaerales bacterium]
MIELEANYSKKLGLPGYSSHQYSLTIRKEVSDITKVEAESRELFQTLQSNVDRDIQQVGYLPVNGNGNHQKNGNSKPETWACSPKQKDLILKIVDEHNLDKSVVENLSKERFEGIGVKLLNTMQASMLIKELLERYPSKENNHGRYARRQPAGGNHANRR